VFRGSGKSQAFVAAWLLAAAALLAWVPARSEAVEPGVVSDLAWYIPDSEKQRSVEATTELGSKWSRIHVQWREAEPARGAFNEWWMDEYEEAVDLARAAGQQVVVMVYNAPAWASGSPTRNVPADPADFANFVSELAERLRGRVAGYEIWNEPNFERFWSGGPDAAEYAQLLRAVYPAVRAADPAAKVVFGGLSGNDYAFLERAYDAGAKGHFDVLATHPYTYCGDSGPDEVRRRGDGRLTPDTFTAYRELHASMAARGDVKPIWVTEFGWNTTSRKCDPGAGFWQGGVSAQQQAANLRRAFEIFASDPYVEVAMWYSLRDPYWLVDAPADPEATTGLLTVGYERKPAFAAFRDFATGAGATGGDASGSPAESPTRTTVKLRKRGTKVTGQVTGATSGEVTIAVEHRARKGWRHLRDVTAHVGPDGSFAASLGKLPSGKRRVQAQFAGTADALASSSSFVSVRRKRRG
jgi:hypothetical protein